MNSLPKLFAEGRKLDDWLSPILVKELRQGMRGRIFIISFMGIQVCLIILVLGNLAAQHSRYALDNQNGFFWTIVGFALLLLMPFRGLTAISHEVRHNTIETILLTRLTAWRVVFGKWSALFAQSLLFVSAVLPYVVLRYFIGGDDVVSDFEALFLMLWSSGILIAFSIAVSSLGNAVLRIIMVVVAAPTLITMGTAGVYGSSGLHTRHSSFWEFWDMAGWLTIYGIFVPALLFELTASTIAPVAENHAVRRRALALLFFVTSLFMGWVSRNPSNPAVPTSLFTLVCICYVELSEKPRLLPRLIAPLNRLGWLGRIVGIFFLPGWPSALLFSLTVIPPAIFLHALTASDIYNSVEDFSVPLFIFAIFGSVLPPILICHLLWPKMKQVFVMVAIYNGLLMAIAALLEGFAELTGTKINEALAFVPGVPVLMTSMGGGTHKLFLPLCMTGNILTLTIVLVILLAASRRYFVELFTMMRTAREAQPSPGRSGPEVPAP